MPRSVDEVGVHFVNILDPVENSLQPERPVSHIGIPRILQLVAEAAELRRLLRLLLPLPLLLQNARDIEGAADGDDDRQNEPGQDFDEKTSHAATPSSGERTN